MLVAQHASSQPAGAPVWQTHHPGQMYSSGEYAAGSLGDTQPPAPPGQAASWDPNMQGNQTSFASGPGPVYSSAGGGSFNEGTTNKYATWRCIYILPPVIPSPDAVLPKKSQSCTPIYKLLIGVTF